MTWRDLSLSEREREYSPSSMVGGDLTKVIARYRDESARVRAAFPPVVHRYGESDLDLLDLYLPKGALRRVPLHVFIHGGYWQELSRHESSFMAMPLLERGAAVAVVDYTLAPKANLDQMVGQCRRAVAWLGGHAESLGVDPRRILLSGSSAGGHLAAMVLTEPHPVASAVLFSGVYDLEPLIGTYINEAVGIDADTASRLSPLRLEPARSIPIVVATGAIETAEFQRQSNEFAVRWAGLGCQVRRITVPGRNHFDVPEDLGLTGTVVGEATLAFEQSR